MTGAFPVITEACFFLSMPRERAFEGSYAKLILYFEASQLCNDLNVKTAPNYFRLYTIKSSAFVPIQS